MFTLDQLKLAMPTAGTRADLYYKPLMESMEACEINNCQRITMYLSEIGHESSDLLYMAEIWGPGQVPEQRTYAHRGGNDKAEALALVPTGIDPGKYFRGYGPMQVTFFDNQVKVADHFGIARSDMVPWLQTPEGGCKASAYFWMTHGLNEIADAENYDDIANEFDAVCDIINIGHRTDRVGDSNGYRDRLARYERVKLVLYA